MQFSKFGTKLTSKSGILQLMDDIGRAASGDKPMLMLGAGNPAHIPQVEKIWRKTMEKILTEKGEFEKMLGDYTTQQGDLGYRQSIARFLKNLYGWHITEKNVAIMPSSQTAFFYLFNLLGGEYQDNKKKQILLPIVPEYIGYADQGISADLFTSSTPEITYIDKHTFKYNINFYNLKLTDDIAAICVSRPTNPTGNVITDEEVNHLRHLARKHNIPLIIDNAYGAPFPNILFVPTHPVWDEHIIHSFSMSKLGLPSTRTSIIIAAEEYISALSSMNAIISLATGRVGEFLTKDMISDGSILDLSNKVIQPYYLKRSQEAINILSKNIPDRIPYYLHKSEGALFLWLWCKDLPVTSLQLYEKLVNAGVIVVPGEYFFPGLQTEWKHKYECLRISYSGKEEVVKKGLEIIAEEIKKVYN